MSLPKISMPTMQVTVPSTQAVVSVSSMRVRDEKILLMAKEDGSDGAIFHAIFQIVSNCLVDAPPSLLGRMTATDLSYIFMNIRAISISNMTKVSFRDEEDGKIYDFDIDLFKVQVSKPEKVEPSAKITDTISVSLRWPPAQIYATPGFMGGTASEQFDLIMMNSIDGVHSEGIRTTKKFIEESEADQKEFYNSLPVSAFESMKTYLNSMPTLYHLIEYTNEKGTKRSIPLTTLSDFFTLV